jgi:hypothetical protein
MKITFGRILSFLIVIAYMIGIIVEVGWAPACLVICLVPFFPLALIWFPDEFGAFTNTSGFWSINEETPAIFVSIMGWMLLLGMPFLFYFCFLDK